MRFVFDVSRRVAWVFAFPYVAFWSLSILIPSLTIHYTAKTLVAFWGLFWVVRWLVQNIRHGDWSDVISLE